ncbi:MAG TPA: hemolysin family protein, partial [Bacteroidales bacterium]|nr:hemolysin family protein [Bacteroidales bacterium]HPJ60922.1 hemolysin family protein [Bacteroidales bacterium]
FLCSIMEAVLLSTPNSFLIVSRDSGKSWAGILLDLKKNIDKPLSAILTLNTIAHTVGAAGVGAQATKVFGEAWFGVVSALLTLIILIFSEIIPKTIGALFWRNLASPFTWLMRFTVIITYPFVLLSALITKLFSGKLKGPSTSREEISALASIGAHEGLFNEKEYKIIQNLLRLKNVKVTEIMTPRVVVASADETMLLSDFLKDKNYLKFSRIPVYSENTENITGYVFRQTVFEKLAEDRHELRLRDLKRDIVIIPGTKVLFDVWEKLLEEKEHIALVVDEYGGIDGIVTMEDIIETLLGLEIVDEKDTVTDMQKYALERWRTRQIKYNLLEESDRDSG